MCGGLIYVWGSNMFMYIFVCVCVWRVVSNIHNVSECAHLSVIPFLFCFVPDPLHTKKHHLLLFTY